MRKKAVALMTAIVTVFTGINITSVGGASSYNTYRFFDGVSSTWEEAEAYCESLGGHLATLTSTDENAYVYNLMVESGYTNAYFGLSDSETEGEWKWVTGEPFIYSNWHPGEPNNESSREDYAMFYWKYTDGTWNDGTFGSGTVRGDDIFICEWETGGRSSSSSSSSYVNVEQNDGAEIHLNFDTASLETITDTESAENLLSETIDNADIEQRTSIKAKDELAYLAEEAAARACVINAESDIVISDEVVGEALETVSDTKDSLENILDSRSVKVRSVRNKVIISTSKESSVSISKEKLTENIDVVEAVTPFGSFEFEPDSVSELSVDTVGENRISVSFEKAASTSKVTVKFPDVESDGYKAVVDEEGNIIGGKYNPVTNELSAKIDESGEFTYITNEIEFSDIKDLSEEAQYAIKKLASKGIINGTSAEEFSPDSPITRAETAALIVRILNMDDPNADGFFSDVTKENWYFGSAGVSKREKIITGYEDNTFRGDLAISKVQITSVLARTLSNRLGYYDVLESTLNTYADNSEIADWARSDVSLATYANMVVKRTDGYFMPNDEMTRGDAAVILEKLFDKVW